MSMHREGKQNGLEILYKEKQQLNAVLFYEIFKYFDMHEYVKLNEVNRYFQELRNYCFYSILKENVFENPKLVNGVIGKYLASLKKENDSDRKVFCKGDAVFEILPRFLEINEEYNKSKSFDSFNAIKDYKTRTLFIAMWILHDISQLRFENLAEIHDSICRVFFDLTSFMQAKMGDTEINLSQFLEQHGGKYLKSQYDNVIYDVESFDKSRDPYFTFSLGIFAKLLKMIGTKNYEDQDIKTAKSLIVKKSFDALIKFSINEIKLAAKQQEFQFKKYIFLLSQLELLGSHYLDLFLRKTKIKLNPMQKVALSLYTKCIDNESNHAWGIVWFYDSVLLAEVSYVFDDKYCDSDALKNQIDERLKTVEDGNDAHITLLNISGEMLSTVLSANCYLEPTLIKEVYEKCGTQLLSIDKKWQERYDDVCSFVELVTEKAELSKYNDTLRKFLAVHKLQKLKKEITSKKNIYFQKFESYLNKIIDITSLLCCAEKKSYDKNEIVISQLTMLQDNLKQISDEDMSKQLQKAIFDLILSFYINMHTDPCRYFHCEAIFLFSEIFTKNEVQVLFKSLQDNKNICNEYRMVLYLFKMCFDNNFINLKEYKELMYGINWSSFCKDKFENFDQRINGFNISCSFDRQFILIFMHMYRKNSEFVIQEIKNNYIFRFVSLCVFQRSEFFIKNEALAQEMQGIIGGTVPDCFTNEEMIRLLVQSVSHSLLVHQYSNKNAESLVSLVEYLFINNGLNLKVDDKVLLSSAKIMLNEIFRHIPPKLFDWFVKYGKRELFHGKTFEDEKNRSIELYVDDLIEELRDLQTSAKVGEEKMLESKCRLVCRKLCDKNSDVRSEAIEKIKDIMSSCWNRGQIVGFLRSPDENRFLLAMQMFYYSGDFFDVLLRSFDFWDSLRLMKDDKQKGTIFRYINGNEKANTIHQFFVSRFIQLGDIKCLKLMMNCFQQMQILDKFLQNDDIWNVVNKNDDVECLSLMVDYSQQADLLESFLKQSNFWSLIDERLSNAAIYCAFLGSLMKSNQKAFMKINTHLRFFEIGKKFNDEPREVSAQSKLKVLSKM